MIMRYTLEDLKEIMDEEVVIVGDFDAGEITGTLEEVMGDSGILFIGGKSIAIADITEIYLFDDAGETYLFDPSEHMEDDEVGVFSDEQFLSLKGEYVTIVKLASEGEEILQGVVVKVDLEKQLLTLENWENKPIQFNEVITLKVKDENGDELELAPENYLSAFNEDEQYAISQFYALIKSQVRIVVAANDLEIEVRGTLEKVSPEEGGYLVLKEQKGSKIPIVDILDFFVITNNGDEQFLVPLLQGGDMGYSAFEMGDGMGYYSPDILQYLVNREVKLKGDFDGAYEIKGLLIEVNEALFKLKNIAKDFVIEDISGVYVQDKNRKWDYVPPITFEHRNKVAGAYDPLLLDGLIGNKAVFTISLLQGGVAELSGYVKSIDIENFTLKIEEEDTEFEFPFILDIRLQRRVYYNL
jgi:ribosome maturation factor RimP